MSRIVTFNQDEIAEPQDLSNVGEFAREALDTVVRNAIAYPKHWAGFTVAAASASTLSITRGALFADAEVFDSFQTLTVDVLTHIPLVTNDQRYIALLVRGDEETVNDSRLVETDAETGETVVQAVEKTVRRYVTFTVMQGLPSPTPVRPAVPENEACLCFVRLTTTGIAEIEMAMDDRVKSLYEIEGRLRVAEGDIVNTVRRTTTLETDLANLAARLRNIPRPELMRQIQRDIAATRRQLALPDDARGYAYDNGLLRSSALTFWDYAHADWLARVREGIRFSYANERDEQLQLLDADSDDINLYFDPAQPSLGQLLLPAWTKEARIVVDSSGTTGSKNISQQVHTVTTAIRREISRSSTEYGPTVTVCENNAEWGAGVADKKAGEMFAQNGETFQVVAELDPWNNDLDHQVYNVAQVITSTWTEVYWDYVTETFGVNGSIYGQTFLNTHPLITPSIELEFTRAGTAGDVHLMICECDASGQPLFERVLVKSVVAAANVRVGKVEFTFRPTLFEAGKRYAWYVVTTGNHALKTVLANKFAQGSLFYCTDGAWAQGAPEEDFVFTLNACKFAATRTVVDFGALTLDGGMTELRLLYPGWTPASTNLMWQVRPSGADAWTSIEPTSANALVGLPALVQLRAVFLGTTELQPSIVLGARARGFTGRMRNDFRAVSKVIPFGFSTTEILVETKVDYFDPAHHTVANKLIVGATVYTPTATSVTVDISKPGRRVVLSTFTVPSTATARIRVDITTDNVVLCPFIQDISLYAI